MKKSLLLMLLVGVLFTWAVAEGADWTYFWTNASDCKWYYDRASIKSSGKGKRTVWVRESAESSMCISDGIESRKKHNLPTQGYEDFRQTIQQYVFDCPSKQSGVTSRFDYDNNGKVLDIFNPDSGGINLGPIIPESLDSRIYEIVCK